MLRGPLPRGPDLPRDLGRGVNLLVQVLEERVDVVRKLAQRLILGRGSCRFRLPGKHFRFVVHRGFEARLEVGDERDEVRVAGIE